MEKRQLALFQKFQKETWILIFGCLLYFFFCWILFSMTVDPMYGVQKPPAIAADSNAYFVSAGLNGGNESDGVDQGSLLNLGGSSLGPVAVAIVCRTPFGVACFNCILFLIVLWWAGTIPGVRREYFAVMMALIPQMVPTLMTLNKEMLGIAGLVAFAAYLYGGSEGGKNRRSRRGSKWLLFAAFLFSMFARWEQVLIPLWYLAAESRISPVRGRPGRAIAALLAVCSVGWFAVVHIVHLNLGGFLVGVSGGGGVLTRLYTIQENGGYFLVALPKVIMNIAGRWVTPGYFLGPYWEEDFGNSWQNAYIGELTSLCMLGFLAFALLRGRFRLSHPLIHLTSIYFICTAVNPFVQPRYIYPAYALLLMELSRRKEDSEQVAPFWTPPALAPSYKMMQGRAPARVE